MGFCCGSPAGRTWTQRTRGNEMRKGQERRERRRAKGGHAEAYRGENSAARNESGAVENPDRNQSDSICIMEKAPRQCLHGALRACCALLSSHPLALSFSLVPSVSSSFCLWLSPFLLLALCHSQTGGLACGLVQGSGGTKELVNGFIWIRSSPYLSHPPCYLPCPPPHFISPPPL